MNTESKQFIIIMMILGSISLAIGGIEIIYGKWGYVALIFGLGWYPILSGITKLRKIQNRRKVE